MGRSGIIKPAIPALIAVALVGCSDKKPAIGRFQVREFIVDEYYGDKNTKAVTHGLSHCKSRSRRRPAQAGLRAILAQAKGDDSSLPGARVGPTLSPEEKPALIRVSAAFHFASEAIW